MKAEEVKSYELLSEQEIRIGSFVTKAKLLRHKKTGARVALMENDDENKVFFIGFRTPPKDSTGVAHILEHSVLCGSDKFPLKDPFVELAKGSLNTFLNAMTYPDKTLYPVASCNDKDFQNLVDVYLDAVFHPNIYKKKGIFLQEGWHYELDEEKGELSYNGVVYNEMKGAFSDADEILLREIQNALFPDTSYGVESGGDPKYIPDLTYEQFLEFHSKFYHPSNSYIYLYGNMDMAEKLEFIDKEYLSAYEAINVDSEIRSQKEFEKPLRVERDYPVDDSDDLEEKSYLSVNYVIGDNLDPEIYLAFQILDKAICNNNGTPLRTALLDVGLGKDIFSTYDNGIKQPVFSIVAKDAAQDREEEFLAIVRRELEKIVREGFDKKALEASLNTLEFKYLEADYGRFPKGLMYGLQMMDSWLFDDSKPFIHIDANETYRSLREKLKTDYFEKLVEKYLLQNPHQAVVVMKPCCGLLDQQEKELADKLEELRINLSPEALDSIRRDRELLAEFQEREDTKEELEMLPLLRREDLGTEAAKIFNEERKIGETPFLFHDIFTNGIGYLSLAFNLKDVPEKYYPYIGILKTVLFDLSTEHYSYGDLSNEIDFYTGGMNASTSVISDFSDPEKCKTFFTLNTKYKVSNLTKALELVREGALTSNIRDEKRLLEILREYKAVTQQSMMAAGHALSAVRALSYESYGAAYTEILTKLSLYRLVCDYEEHFAEKKEELTERLGMLTKMIFRAENLQVDYTGDRKDIASLEKEIEALKNDLFTAEVEKGSFVPKLVKKNEGFLEPSQVQYVCRAGSFRKRGLPYDGSLRALKIILDYDYLWTNVRVKNGAYGCSCNFDVSGDSYFVSYRDPQLVKTVDVYENAAEYVKNFQADERTMTKYIIGAVGELDTPMTPSAKGIYSKQAYQAGVTQEDLQKIRDELLATDPEKIRSMAKYVEAVLEADCFVVTGNSGKIKENEKLFGKLETLF